MKQITLNLDARPVYKPEDKQGFPDAWRGVITQGSKTLWLGPERYYKPSAEADAEAQVRKMLETLKLPKF